MPTASFPPAFGGRGADKGGGTGGTRLLLGP